VAAHLRHVHLPRMATLLAATAAAIGLAAAPACAHADIPRCLPTGSAGCTLAPNPVGGPVIRPGDLIQTNDEQCTVGLTGSVGATRYAITDGHCWEPNAQVYDANDDAIGVFAAGVRDGTSAGDPMGYGLVLLTGATSPSGSFQGKDVESVDTEPHVGDPLCKLGERTGLTCGTISRISDRDIYLSGMQVDEGDSGGIVYLPTPDGQASFVGLIQGTVDNNTTDVEPAAELFGELQAYARTKLGHFNVSTS